MLSTRAVGATVRSVLRKASSRALLGSGGLILATAGMAAPTDRKQEGDWYIADNTDNNTGQREVYASQMYFPSDQHWYVTLTMRCSGGKPTFFIDWTEIAFPDQTVVTISPILADGSNPAEERYVFEKTEDPIEHGLRASPETSSKIVAALGQAISAEFTAHLSSGRKTAVIDVAGMPGAWSRVSRHCPFRTMPVPPM
jgi:hypothetical protein